MVPLPTVITRDRVTLIRDPCSTLWTKTWHRRGQGRGEEEELKTGTYSGSFSKKQPSG